VPLRWTIDHPNRFVHIVADGPVGLPELEEHFDAIAIADAMGYAKLFDASRTDPIYNDDDVMLMGARLSAYTETLESGPLAVIGTSAETATAFHRFVNVSPSRRPAGFFATEREARAWLETQTDAVNRPPRSSPPDSRPR
jgi:hypothetical protein